MEDRKSDLTTRYLAPSILLAWRAVFGQVRLAYIVRLAQFGHRVLLFLCSFRDCFCYLPMYVAQALFAVYLFPVGYGLAVMHRLHESPSYSGRHVRRGER